MFAKTFRGSIFISLMLIVSMTLTGCSFDIGSIISGLQNVIGDMGGKIGGFIEKGIGFAKDFVGKAKEFVGPMIDAGKEIFKDFAPIAEKITDGFGKVEGVLDQAGNVGDAVNSFAENISNSGRDSAGEDIDPDAPTSEVVPDPDDEDAEIVINPEGDDDNDNSAANDDSAEDEVSTREELEAQAQALVSGARTTIDGLTSFQSNYLNNLDIAEDEAKALKEKIDNGKTNLGKILQDPTSDEAKKLFEKAKDDFEEVSDKVKEYGNYAEGALDSLKGIFEDTKDVFNSFNDAYSSIRNLFN